MKSHSYKDLIVWQKSIDLGVAVYDVCAHFPKSECYGLADQMKRASVSVTSNIAEGQARQYSREFVQFLFIAHGSLAELDSQRIIAQRLNLLSVEHSERLDTQIVEIRRMLFSLIAKLKTVLKLKTENSKLSEN